MRVFQVINNFGLDRGGAERLARTMHEGLVAKGVDSRILAIEQCSTESLPNSQSLGLANPRDPRALWRLDRALSAEIGPGDIVHAHLFPSILYVSLLRQSGRIKCPALMTEHSTWNRRRSLFGGRSLDRVIHRGFERIIAISEPARQALIDTHPAAAAKTHVIENGAVLRHTVQPRRDARTGPARIVSVGRLARPKNFGTALKALSLLARDDWTYTIVGDGPERQVLEAQALALGLGGKVRFTEQLADVYPELEVADIFLMPSLWEGFGLAAVEAMNCGLPLVVSDVPGLREIAGEAASLSAPPHRADLLAAAIGTLIDDRAMRKRLGHEAFTRSLQFSHERMLDEYLALWNRAAQTAPA